VKRGAWFAAGFTAGLLAAAAATVGFSLASLLWGWSACEVERISGLDLPRSTSFEREQNEYDGWFGDGYTFRVFRVPSEFARASLASCPEGFRPTALGESGIGLGVHDFGERSNDPGCAFVRDKPGRTDYILISSDRIFHLRADS
jgi:hypothetical protein